MGLSCVSRQADQAQVDARLAGNVQLRFHTSRYHADAVRLRNTTNYHQGPSPANAPSQVVWKGSKQASGKNSKACVQQALFGSNILGINSGVFLAIIIYRGGNCVFGEYRAMNFNRGQCQFFGDLGIFDFCRLVEGFAFDPFGYQ